MKKIGSGILIGLIVLVFSGVVLAAANVQVGQRAYVLTENPAVKVMLGVRHEFPGAFSTEVSPQLKILSSLGLIKTKPVQIYEITGKPVCGDGIIHSSEQCGELGLPECPEGYVCENCKCVEAVLPCAPDNQLPWGIVKVNGGSGGTGIKVAVLDTGVDRDHPDLVNNIVGCVALGYESCEDGHGHGTHVAGTVLANGKIIGVTPQTSLMAVKICSDGGWCYGDDIAAGIRYAADNGANIISMSIGGDSPDPQVLSAIDYAVNAGVLPVAAAGNDGPADGSIDYPGAYYKVVAVGAIDINEAVPYWSSRGIDNGNNFVISEKEIEFGAPGVSVESTYNDGCYTYKSGTSMATPHVSGLAAKLWQGSATATRTYLRSIAKDIYTTGYDTATGYGLPIAPAAPACSSDTDCNDNKPCTIDTCVNPGTANAYCSYIDITYCFSGDGCCPAGCTPATDSDCQVASCDTCFKGVCDGKCNPGQEDATCPDCL